MTHILIWARGAGVEASREWYPEPEQPLGEMTAEADRRAAELERLIGGSESGWRYLTWIDYAAARGEPSPDPERERRIRGALRVDAFPWGNR